MALLQLGIHFCTQGPQNGPQVPQLWWRFARHYCELRRENKGRKCGQLGRGNFARLGAMLPSASVQLPQLAADVHLLRAKGMALVVWMVGRHIGLCLDLRPCVMTLSAGGRRDPLPGNKLEGAGKVQATLGGTAPPQVPCQGSVHWFLPPSDR